ncbi:YjbQ family protein [Patescibacteria group bacterium AH-259-L07]|nr:YjbQ family protein [Patescibacteria group bacterium AH-259-L07]
MNVIDKELNLELKDEFTSVKSLFESLIKENKLNNANIICWVPHEVSSLIQIGWEDGLLDDLKDFLNDKAPKGKWMKHDEPDTPFRHNFYEHIRSKLVGNISMTLIVKDRELYIGKYQDLYFYSPVYEYIPNQKIFCRILKFD